MKSAPHVLAPSFQQALRFACLVILAVSATASRATIIDESEPLPFWLDWPALPVIESSTFPYPIYASVIGEQTVWTSLTVEVGLDQKGYHPGDTATFWFEVTNNGPIAISLLDAEFPIYRFQAKLGEELVFADPNFWIEVPIDWQLDLAPGQSWRVESQWDLKPDSQTDPIIGEYLLTVNLPFPFLMPPTLRFLRFAIVPEPHTALLFLLPAAWAGLRRRRAC
ncbi:MAG: PEP-CTERM sorting domain-containing protein [Phycisphaeraceae bacterium]|nr:PEP-CTERM sorting domain-containing protein [Phycisphaeraceae bacterium]